MFRELPPNRALQIIEEYGGNPDAVYHLHQRLISKSSCNKLVSYIDEGWQEASMEETLPYGTYHNIPADIESYQEFEGVEDYKRKIKPAKLIELIGKTEALKVFDFYFETKEPQFDIDCMYLVRHASGRLGDPVK